MIGGLSISSPALIGAVTGFSPSKIAGLQLWLRADALALADNTAVATWADNSGNGNDVTQATSSARPTFKTGILNGLPVVRFDGTDDFLSNSNAIASGACTIFSVAKSANAGATDQAIVIQGNWPNPFQGHYIAGNGNFAYVTGAGDFGSVSIGGAVFNVWTTTNDGSAVAVYKNGSQEATASGSVTAGSPLYIGRSVFGQFFPGDVAGVLIYDSALSDTDREAVEAYLATKYAL